MLRNLLILYANKGNECFCKNKLAIYYNDGILSRVVVYANGCIEWLNDCLVNLRNMLTSLQQITPPPYFHII